MVLEKAMVMSFIATRAAKEVFKFRCVRRRIKVMRPSMKVLWNWDEVMLAPAEPMCYL